MISVTDEAKDLLQEMLQQAEQQAGIEDEEVGIRLAPTTAPEEAEGGQVGLGLMLDRPREGDQVVEHHGKNVLLVDSSTSSMLDGITLDAVDTPQGRQLAVSQ